MNRRLIDIYDDSFYIQEYIYIMNLNRLTFKMSIF